MVLSGPRAETETLNQTSPAGIRRKGEAHRGKDGGLRRTRPQTREARGGGGEGIL